MKAGEGSRGRQDSHECPTKLLLPGRACLTRMGEKRIFVCTLKFTRTGEPPASPFHYISRMNEPSPSILIVEDEAVIAAEIEMTLRRMGYRIAGKARNGDKALDLLASTNPDLALLDIDIKGTLSGIDLARVIRKKYNYPFVFLTAFADRATLAQVKETLPYGFVVKPFNDKDLLSAIELALYKYATEQPAGLPERSVLNRRLADPLSAREYEVLTLLHAGLAYREVGTRLHIGLNTVKTYQKSLFAKAGVGSRHQLTQWLNQHAVR